MTSSDYVVIDPDKKDEKEDNKESKSSDKKEDEPKQSVEASSSIADDSG